VAELLGRRLARHLTALDPLAQTVQARVRDALDANPALRDALDGAWLGTPLHPPLTDVPIGAGTLAALFDAAETLTGSPELARAADLSLVVGVLGTLPAAATGVTDARGLHDEARRVAVGHAILNGTALALNVVSLGLRLTGRRGAAKAASGVGYGLQTVAAHIGGELVFRLGVGVRGSDWDRRVPDPGTEPRAAAG
jgi:uncharacterized membrane protein